MYDLSELDVTGKEVATLILIVFALLLGAGFAGYCIGWERAEDVYCNGSGAESVTNELGQVGTAIENAGTGISEAQGHAGNVQAGIDNATEQADYIHGTAKTSTELIGQCQSIISAIRQRGKADKVTH